jgi:glutamate-ammonia-ligase adenylyltransferase
MSAHQPLIARLKTAPVVHDAAAAKAALAELAAAARHAEGASDLTAQLRDKKLRPLLLAVADHSPFLWRLALGDPARLARLVASAPEDAIDAVAQRLDDAGATVGDAAELMRILRRAKQEASLLIALADLGGVWDAVEVTRALTRFADAAVGCALRFLLLEADAAGKLALPSRDAPEDGCGLVILALGKHGAGELNYSSDVDLVVLFDPDAPALPPDSAAQALYVRLTKGIVKLLQERTEDGYVLRVDLRLRPDPGSTQIAISLPAAATYYETLGQNWERAAFIKARPVAGDKRIGEAFLKELAPFIWRKYFDYAAIADVHAMKRQIHAVRGHAEVVVPGHDVKVGRGGIREIEFFVQTQQLIFGGRRPALRGSRTLDMLQALADDGWITQGAVVDLSFAYKYLRGIEHRLQMLADEQTQRLPSDPEALERFARFCGYKTYEAFAAAITAQFRIVEAEYARLFEHAPGLDTAKGSLVFTGVSDDPETIETLQGMGFRDPALAAETVRGWHFGRRAAVQSARAREVLTELIPGLLEAFSGSGDADAALAAFDSALSRMPAAIELFSILRSNTAVRELFGDILGGAPRLATTIAARPHVLDAAIDPSLIESGEHGRDLALRVGKALAPGDDLEAFLDRARYVAQDEMFLIGVRLVSGAFDPGGAAAAYSALAETIVAAMTGEVTRHFEIEYGRPPGARAVVVALGKLGSREMTASSDLDLMLIYDFDEAKPDSVGGARSLHAVQYYTRLTQRLVSALTAPTRAGRLYEVDMRLRPSGRKGPVATQLSAFTSYHASEAETWEHMALTRARVVAGDETLARDVDAVIAKALARKRAPETLRKDVADMRVLIAQEKGDSDPWDLKLAQGGLLDVEFVAQYLVLRHVARRPEIRDVATGDILARARDLKLLDDADALIDAHRALSDVTQLLRLSVDGKFDPAKAPEGVKRRIASSLGLPDFSALAGELAARRREVRAIYDAILAAK